MSQKIHTLSGQSFHGAYCVGVRGPAEGFVLSAGQAKKIADAACGIADCECGGGYGDGDDTDGAYLDHDCRDRAVLRPAGYFAAQERKERAAWLAQMDREEAEGLAMMRAQYGEQS